MLYRCHCERTKLRDCFVAALLAMTVSLPAADAAESSKPPQFSKFPGLSIHGENSLAAEMHRTGGAGDKTLLRRGEFLTDILKLKIDQVLPHGWTSHTDIHGRKTQDPQIDKRRDVHLLGLTSELYNKTTRLTFGDFFGDFSQYTLGQSLEGFQLAYDTQRFEAKGVAGISQRADETRAFERQVYGARAEALVVEDSKNLKDARVGFNFVGTQDDKGSVENKSGVMAAESRVGSLNGHAVLLGKSVFDSEIAESWTDEDTRDPLIGRNVGTALRVNNQTQWTKKGKTKLLYEWVTPRFDTLSGSAVSDRVNFTSRANYKWNPAWVTDAAYRTQYNKLNKSTAEKRTYLHVPSASISWTPSSSDWTFQDFFSRLFWEQRRRLSDDADSGQVDFVSDEIGIEDEFKVKKYNLSSGWTLRHEDDDLQKLNNRLTNEAYIGARIYRKFLGVDAVPSTRWTLIYDAYDKEGGRDLRGRVTVGLDLDFKHGLKLNQRYSLENNRRHAQDSDSLKFDADVGLEYQIPRLRGTTLKVSYTTADYAHDMSTQSFSEHNLRADLICKF